jgi:hypothetical protein
LEPATAAQIAWAYAAETRNILDPEAFIAERRYRQQLMAAQTVRIHMITARVKRQEAYQEAACFCIITDSVIANSAARGRVQHNPDSDEAYHLYNKPDPTELQRLCGKYTLTIITLHFGDGICRHL